MQNAKSNLITIGQLSRKLRISVVWLRAQADKGLLPCMDANGKLLFNYQAVKKRLAELATRGGH